MKNEIKAGAMIGYINMFLNIIIALLYTPFMLKLMGESEYGLYSLIVSIISYLSILDLGFGNAMIRFVSRSQARKDNNEQKINGIFLFLYTIIGGIALIIGIIISSNVNLIFQDSLNNQELQKAKILVLILVFNVALSFPLSVFDSYIIANEKYKYSKLMTLFKNVTKPLLMTPLLLLGYKSISMTIVTAALNIFFHFLMLFYCLKFLKMKIHFSIKNIDKKLLKEIWTYSFFIFLNIIVDSVFNNTDQIILGIVIGTSAVAVYSIAYQIIQMNTMCSTVISGLFLPKVTKILEEKNSNEEVSSLFIKVSRIQIYIMMLIFFGFVIFGKNFIKLWVGANYLDAYHIILIIIGPSIVPLTQNIGISIIQAKNMHQFRAVVYILIAVINVAISIPLAKLYGGIGTAIGTAIANICGQIITMNIFYYKVIKLDIPKYWNFFLKMFIEYGIMSLIIKYIISNFNNNVIIYILEIILFCLLYCIITFINLNKNERIFFKGITNKVLRRKV